MSNFFYARDNTVGLSAFRHANAFLKSNDVRWWQTSPHDEIVLSGEAFVLAEIGEEYIVYSPAGSDFIMELTKGTFHWRWFDPSTGSFDSWNLLEALGGPVEFSKPSKNEWVLHVVNVSVADSTETVPVRPTLKTDSVPKSDDNADDAAIWIHPSNPALSTIIITEKFSTGGFRVYDMEGHEIQFVNVGFAGNVDLRDRFPLGGAQVALVTAGNRDSNTIVIYKVNPATRFLENVAARDITVGIDAYGSCMYHSQVTGRIYFFVNSRVGEVEQWELFDDGSGLVDANLVRSFALGSQVEGCVADDELGHFYIGEEKVGVWKFSAEPGDGSARIQVDTTGNGGYLTSDVEGMTLYNAGGGTGYLIVSSQGNDEFAIYRREGENEYIGSFDIVAGNGLDDTTFTDGIDVTHVPLGPNFPHGLFVAQDDNGQNSPRPPDQTTRQNFKLVPWESIAYAFSTPLVVNSSPAPFINSTPVTDAAAGEPYSYDVDARGDPAPAYDLTVTPIGMTIDAFTGLINWTPTTIGTFAVTVEAVNREGTDSQSFNINVVSEPMTISFQDGLFPTSTYAGTKDASIVENTPSTNLGTTNICGVDGDTPGETSLDQSILLSWDISTIPAGSTVQSASLTLNVINPSQQTYQLYQSLQNWVEPEVTWDIRATGFDWQLGGAQGVSDRGTAVVANVSASTTGSHVITLTQDGVAAIQSWVDDGSSNRGFIMTNSINIDGLDFDCREDASAANRPKLTVTYVPPAGG
jgi:3-phytase